MKSVLIVPALILSHMLTSSVASAQDPGDWERSCGEAGCMLSRTANDAATGRRVATIAFTVPADPAETGVIAAIVPLGVALEPGVKLVFGDAVQLMPFNRCVPDGCQATARLEAELLAAAIAAETLDVQFFAADSDNPISAPLPAAGLEQALSDARNSLGAPR